jgi:hypothetical protein
MWPTVTVLSEGVRHRPRAAQAHRSDRATNASGWIISTMMIKQLDLVERRLVNQRFHRKNLLAV